MRIKHQLIALFFLFVSGAKSQFALNGLDFDGSNDVVQASSVPSFFNSPSSNNFTIEGWIYPRASLFARILFAQPSTTNYTSFGTGVGNVIYVYINVNGTMVSVATTAGIPQNQWTHVAARWTASTNNITVFFNGVQQATGAGGGSSTGTNGLMTLGTRPGGAQYFVGAIDELRVWSEARTQCDIQSNMYNSITGAQTNLALNYNFNQGTAGGTNTGITNLPDVSTNANNGTLANFALAGTTSNWIASTATLNTLGAPLSTGTSVSQTVAICSGRSYTFANGSIQNNITAQVVQTSTVLAPGGCVSSITTTVNVKPTYSTNGTASVCAGSSYTFADGFSQNNITTPVIHTSTLQSVLGCDSLVTTSVGVNITYSANVSASVCPGKSYIFPDGTTQNNITALVVHTSSLHTVSGCDSLITTTVNLKPVYAASESKTVCAGSSYTFPDGAVSHNISAAQAHTSTLTSIGGCDSIITTNLSVILVNASVTMTKLVLSANTASASYKWINCNGNVPVPGQTAQSFTPAVFGSYAVIVTANGCTDTSACFSPPVGIVESNSPSLVVNLYPNPVNNLLYVETAKDQAMTVSITDATGRLVRKTDLKGKTPTIDLSDLSPGPYIVRIVTSEGSAVQQIIKSAD